MRVHSKTASSSSPRSKRLRQRTLYCTMYCRTFFRKLQQSILY
nr:MAG TPA: hypothetical protein [Caudoviricetes sp.]